MTPTFISTPMEDDGYDDDNSDTTEVLRGVGETDDILSSSDDDNDDAKSTLSDASSSSPVSTTKVCISSLELFEHVAIYLNRRSFNNATILNKEVYETSQDVSTKYPWPSPTRFRVGSRAWTVAFSYDNGRTIACGTDHGMIHVWYCSTGNRISLKLNDAKVGGRISGGRIHRDRSGSLMSSLRVNCVSYYPSSKKSLLAAAGDDGFVRVWRETVSETSQLNSEDDAYDRTSGQLCSWKDIALLKTHHPIFCAAFVPPPLNNDDNYHGIESTKNEREDCELLTRIVASCLDNNIRIFLMEKKVCIATLPCQGPTLSIAMIPPTQPHQGKAFGNRDANTMEAFSFVSGGSRDEQRLCLWQLPSYCANISMAEDTQRNSEAIAYRLESKCQILFDALSSSHTSFEVGGIDIRSIAMARNGSYLAFTCGKQIGVYVLDRDNSQEPDNQRKQLEIETEQMAALTGSNTTTGYIQSTSCRFLKGHLGDVRAVSICPNMKLLASACSNGTIRLWRVSDGLCLKKWLAHADFLVCSITFPPTDQCNGRSLVSVGSDGTLAVWRV